jgi:hypothetical protein
MYIRKYLKKGKGFTHILYRVSGRNKLPVILMQSQGIVIDAFLLLIVTTLKLSKESSLKLFRVH